MREVREVRERGEGEERGRLYITIRSIFKGDMVR